MNPERSAWLAEGLAEHIGRWAGERGGDETLLRKLVLALAEATEAGHVCLDLASIGDADTLAAALQASGVVGSVPSPGPMPLVLDDERRLYLHRAFAQERELAQRLAQRVHQPLAAVGDAARRALQDLFGGAGQAAQKLAAALALQRRLLVLSGGPGTGKTTMVVGLLAILRVQQPALRIALAAPTGKAAARLADAVRQRAATLPPAYREGLPGEAMTLHRLLGLRPDGSAAHDARRPLPVDLLVVDEASMLDLSLAARLLDALPPEATLLLLGDKDQLAAVESGAVFAELASCQGFSDAGRGALAALGCSLPEAQAGGATMLPDSVLWLTRNHRFAADSGIGRLAADVNGGRAADALQALRDRAYPQVDWLDESATPLPQALVAGFEPYLDRVAHEPRDVAAALRAFGRFSVLAALRHGPRGVLQANRWVEAHARARLGGGGGPWYPGRPVMVLRNHPGLRLFNGDVGLTLPDAQGRLQVFFDAPGEAPRALAPARLPPHETAFAITIHKSQGSEFERVAVLLPAAAHPVLSRELLYTAVTRARSGLLLAAPAPVLAAAIGAPTRRHSGLLARLAQATAGAD